MTTMIVVVLVVTRMSTVDVSIPNLMVAQHRAVLAVASLLNKDFNVTKLISFLNCKTAASVRTSEKMLRKRRRKRTIAGYNSLKVVTH